MRKLYLRFSEPERRSGFGYRLYRAVARPMSWLYGAGVRRSRLCNSTPETGWRARSRVVGVGSLTVGGTGKTPLVAQLARLASDNSLTSVILTRGYGRSSTGQVVVPSDMDSVDPELVGDEPAMLARMRTGAAIVVFQDRLVNLQWIDDELIPDVVILDDGYSDRRITRQDDILTLTREDITNAAELLPLGRWRYPPETIRHADIVVVVGRRKSNEHDDIASRLREWGFGGTIIHAESTPTGFTTAAEPEPRPLDRDWGTAYAFCGLGRPRAFFDSLETLGVRVVGKRTFPDHHRYSARDIASIARDASATGADWLVTTAKDAVKLPGNPFPLPLRVLQIALDMADPDGILPATILGDSERGAAQ